MRLYLFFSFFFWELRISGNKQVSRERLEASGWWLGWLVLNFFPWYEEQFVLFCVESDHSFYLSGGNLRLEFQKKKCQTFTWNCKCMTLNREKKEVQNLKLWKKKELFISLKLFCSLWYYHLLPCKVKISCTLWSNYKSIIRIIKTSVIATFISWINACSNCTKQIIVENEEPNYMQNSVKKKNNLWVGETLSPKR